MCEVDDELQSILYMQTTSSTMEHFLVTQSFDEEKSHYPRFYLLYQCLVQARGKCGWKIPNTLDLDTKYFVAFLCE